MSVSFSIYHDKKCTDKCFPIFKLDNSYYVPVKLMKTLFFTIAPNIGTPKPTIMEFIKNNRANFSLFYPDSNDNDYTSQLVVGIDLFYTFIEQEMVQSIKTFIRNLDTVPKKRKYKKVDIKDIEQEFIEAVQQQVRDDYEQGPEFKLFEQQLVEKYQKEFQKIRDTELEAAQQKMKIKRMKYELEILEKGKQVDELEAKAKRIKLNV